MYAIVVSKFNKEITKGLLKGALKAFGKKKAKVFEVPGAWEIPLVAQKLAATKKYKAIVALGAVIKGETAHDYWINHAVFPALQEIMEEFMIPVALGIITCDTWEKAKARSRNNKDNRGYAAAKAAMEMVKILKKIK